MPFGNVSLTPQNIGYLTTSQAIADYVDVITYLLKDKAPQDRNPVFAIGGDTCKHIFFCLFEIFMKND